MGMSSPHVAHPHRRQRAALVGILALLVATIAVVWWRHEQPTAARALRLSIPAGWRVVSTPFAPGPFPGRGTPTLVELAAAGPQAASFSVSWTTTTTDATAIVNAISTTAVGERKMRVGGRQVTMQVLRVDAGLPTETYALSFDVPQEVGGKTFNFSGLCWTGAAPSSAGCSTIFESLNWEPQPAAPGLHGSQVVVALP